MSSRRTRILIVNPNTSAEMTQTIRVAAEASARAVGVEVEVVCPERGPASIEGQFDEVVSAYWTLDCVLGHVGDVDAVLVACYGPHPVIGALREAIEPPVLGILEASVLYAAPLGARFSIVTTSPRWQPLLEEGVRALGLASRCGSVRSSGLAVLDLEELPAEQVRSRLVAEARAAVEQDAAEVIVLGCAGMAGLEASVAEATGVPVVDPVVAGVALLATLARTGARTSKRGLYRPVDAPLALEVPDSPTRRHDAHRPSGRSSRSGY